MKTPKKKEENHIASAAIATGTGAAVGAGTSLSVGGIGLAVGGTGLSIGLFPFVIAGGVVGLAGYGIYRLCKK